MGHNLPGIEKLDSIILSQFTLRELIRQTLFSIADNDTNKLMTGELFEINEDKLRICLFVKKITTSLSVSPGNILLISFNVFPGTTTFFLG